MSPELLIVLAFVIFAVGFFVGANNVKLAHSVAGDATTALAGLKADVAAVKADTTKIAASLKI